jgi:hypothetical protein
MNPRDLARSYAGGRIVIGLLLLLFPGRVFRGVLGGPDEITPGVKMLGRMLGARDAILGAGAVAAMQMQEDGGSDVVRPWMTYGAAADAADALAVLLSYRRLAPRHRFLVLLLAVGGAATGGYLMTALESADQR